MTETQTDYVTDLQRINGIYPDPNWESEMQGKTKTESVTDLTPKSSPLTANQLSKIQAMVAASYSRMSLAQGLNPSAYGGARQYNTVLGYPSIVEIEQYWGMYQRGSIASTIVDLPAQDTWKKPPIVSEGDNVNTPFVRGWNELVDRHKVWSLLTRADRLSGIGQFGVILIGTRDGRPLFEPIDRQKLSQMKTGGVLYYRPFSELRATINTMNTDPHTRRWGLPETYKIKLSEDRAGGEAMTATGEKIVHWTRILHLADNRLDSQVFGVPRLRQVYNVLSDLLYKILGGTAEAIWLEIRKGTLVRPQEGYDLDTTDAAAMQAIQDEIEKFVHDPARFMRLTGMEVQEIGSSTVPDSSPAFQNQISIIAAAKRIPQRILIGGAAGELSAATEDTRQWYGVITDRQRQYAEPLVLRPFIDFHVRNGIIPSPQGGPKAYTIGQLGDDGQRHWPNLFELTELEQSQIAAQLAGAANAMRPVGGGVVLTDPEQRVILGQPPEPVAEGQKLAAQSGAAFSVIEVMRRHKAGEISDKQLNEFMMPTWLEGLENDLA